MDTECRADGENLRDDILSGKAEPYAFHGPSDDCDTLGCDHAYWGQACRLSSISLNMRMDSHSRVSRPHHCIVVCNVCLPWLGCLLPSQEDIKFTMHVVEAQNKCWWERTRGANMLLQIPPLTALSNENAPGAVRLAEVLERPGSVLGSGYAAYEALWPVAISERENRLVCWRLHDSGAICLTALTSAPLTSQHAHIEFRSPRQRSLGFQYRNTFDGVRIWNWQISDIDWVIQDVAYAFQCFLVEYMLPDLPKDDERGSLPKHSPELIKEIEADVHNKRVLPCGYL